MRVPGEATTVLSLSAVVGAANAALSLALAVADADAAFDPSVTLAVVLETAIDVALPAETAAEEADAMIELASEGEMVVVEVELLALLPELPDAARTRWERTWVCVSMNAIVGPARTAWVARSRTLLLRGCMSLVMKMATGPSMPWGTMHWSKGNEMEVAMPPTSI